MFVPLRVLAVAALLAATGGVASAKKIAVTQVSAEPDVADEAGAITLLVRSGLGGDDRVIVDAPPGFNVVDAPARLLQVGAEHGVLLDLGRDGFQLRLTIVIVGATGAPDISVIRAGDGNIHALATGIIDRVTTKLALIKSRAPDVSLGRLRPFARALRLRTTDPTGAARALADAVPNTALRVPAIETSLAGLPAAVSDAPLSAIAARAIGDTKHLAVLAGKADDTALAARALAALGRSDLAAAKAELAGKPPQTGLVALVAVTLAELAGDSKRVDQLVVQGLATDQARAIHALSPGFLVSAPTRAALVEFAEKHAGDAPGAASQTGLTAAIEGVEPARALALVSVRELEEADLERLEGLVKTGTDPTSLRLRAELAIRRLTGKEAWAIESFSTIAAADARAHRYLGWLLMSKSLPAEAAVELAKAGAHGEQARALLLAGDLAAAAALRPGAPVSPEDHVVRARAALAAGTLDVAQRHLAEAERAAPISPLVQTVVLELAAKQANPQRAGLARQLIGDIYTGKAATGMSAPLLLAGSGAGSGDLKTTQRVVVDLKALERDTRILEPMLEGLKLSALAKQKIVIAELGWSPGALAMRRTHPEVLRRALVRLLGAPPYEMQVALSSRQLTGETVPVQQLTALAGDGAVLVYRVQTDGSEAAITLLLYQQGASQATQVARTVAMPGLISFNTLKLVAILGALLVLAILIGLYFTRSMGRIELQIARTTDRDEALCVEISKLPHRPRIPDMLAFHTATKSAGSVVRRRSATLISSGLTLKVPTGQWYVHLYGTYGHGGKLRLVPETCTQQVEVKRGATTEVAFDLVSKTADITVQVIAEPRAGVVVWTSLDLATKYTTGDTGEVEIPLPIGNHMVYVDAHGTQLSKELQVLSMKPQRLTINVARELRLMKGVELDVDAATHNDLELVLAPSGPRTPMPFSAPAHPDASAGARPPLAGPGKSRANTPAPGELLLERYRLTAELGRGAMGVVHRAWDEKLEREVAIKEMAEDLRSIPEAMQLFTQEAKALAQLNHTNIVAMYDQITEVDKIFMIMEYVDGRSLEQIINERKRLPWLEAIGIIDQVCSGLAYAHARKVIHRDIKPANIFLSNDNIVKIGDFGLARVMREVTIRRTEIRGTPLYMAPEQITGTDVDSRSDLYAIGCTLFELVCGQPPFTDGDILYAQMNTKAPAPSSLNPDLPAQLDDVILALLAKHADDRPGSANEVRTMLRDLTKG